jgi:hypothetical protein
MGLIKGSKEITGMLFYKTYLYIYCTSLALSVSTMGGSLAWGQVKLLTKGSIEGRLEISDYGPVSNMRVLAYEETPKGTLRASSKSDAKGSFVLHDLDLNSSYTIRVTPWESAESPPLAEKRGVKLSSVNPNREVNFNISRFTYFVARLSRGNKSITGEVFLDDNMYGKTEETLIALVGLHKVHAKGTGCTSDELRQQFEPRTKERPHEIKLSCK